MIGAMWDRAVDAACRGLCALIPSRHRIVPGHKDPSVPLLRQFAIIRMGRFGALYLQHFCNPEPAHYHRHKWDRMRSFVLSGMFVEERPSIGMHMIGHSRLTSYAMDRDTLHRVVLWGPRCWSLFWMSPQYDNDRFTFYERNPDGTAGKATHWRDYLAARVPSLDTGEIT